MDGSTIDVIVIPIVAAICLATWLFMVYYAASHPRWRGDEAPRWQSSKAEWHSDKAEQHGGEADSGKLVREPGPHVPTARPAPHDDPRPAVSAAHQTGRTPDQP
jgi:hypothetical protein